MLKIDFFTDLTCPFCFVNELHLQVLKHKYDLEIEHQVIQITPDVREKQLILERYPQATEVIPRLNRLIAYSGKQLDYQYKVNSLPGSLLYYRARQESKGKGLKAIHLLNQAYFTEGVNISDRHVINELAEKLQIRRSERDSPEIIARLHRCAAKANTLGISSTPTLIIDEQHRVDGSTSLQQMDRLLAQFSPLAQPDTC